MNVKTATYGKRILCMFAALIMLCAMAIPAFADQTIDVGTNVAQHIRSNSTAMYLNLEGSGAAYKNRDVTVYYYTSDNDQKWYIKNNGNGYKVYTAKASTDGNLYALNINGSNGNCNIYTDIYYNNEDSQVNTRGNANAFEVELYTGTHAGFNLSVLSGTRNVIWGDCYAHYWSLTA